MAKTYNHSLSGDAGHSCRSLENLVTSRGSQTSIRANFLRDPMDLVCWDHNMKVSGCHGSKCLSARI
jgi:hypothetical protein